MLPRMYLRMFLPKPGPRGIRFIIWGSRGLLAGIIISPGSRRPGGQTAGPRARHGVFHLAANYGARLELATAARWCAEGRLRLDQIDEQALAGIAW